MYDKARVSSGYTIATRTVTVDNTLPTAIISAPVGSDLLDGTYRILGTASAAPNFANYAMLRGSRCSPGSWLVGTNPRTTQVPNGQLGTWDTPASRGAMPWALAPPRLPAFRADTVCMKVAPRVRERDP